jgi:hypothetical protein
VEDLNAYEQPTVTFKDPLNLDAYEQPNIMNDNLMVEDLDAYEQPNITKKPDINDKVYEQPENIKKYEGELNLYEQPIVKSKVYEGEKTVYKQPTIDELVEMEISKLGDVYNENTLNVIRKKLKNDLMYKQPERKETNNNLGNIDVGTKKEDVKLEDKLKASGYNDNTIRAINRKIDENIYGEKKEVKKSLSSVKIASKPKHNSISLGNIYDENIDLINVDQYLKQDNRESTNDLEEKISETTKKRHEGKL